MTTVLPDAPPTEWTLADVRARLAGFPASRIRTYPRPARRPKKDVLEAEARTNRICELIDGTLVEKVMASLESMLALELAYFIRCFLAAHDLGLLAGGDGFLKILPGQIRAPDVSFIRWERFPGHKLPKATIFAVAPDLAVEILSKGNTAREMARKLREYFQAGVRLVWYIEPKSRTAGPTPPNMSGPEIGPNDSLLGGEVLPGFELPLAQLFARVEGPRKE